MKVNQQFSTLKHRDTDYEIMNIIVCDNYEVASQIARATLGEDAIAIDTTLYPVAIGDTYHDDNFYNQAGEVIPRNPTEAEEIQKLKTTIARQSATISTLETTLADQDALLADILLSI